MSDDLSVQSSPIVSDERVRDTIRRELHRAINVEKRFNRHQLAIESGVNIHTLDQLLSRNPEKHRRVALADALSLGCVLGERAINSLLALIGFVGQPIEDPDALRPMEIVAEGMQHFSIIAKAAADNRIDHQEEADVTAAADALIATVLPLSSPGRAA